MTHPTGPAGTGPGGGAGTGPGRTARLTAEDIAHARMVGRNARRLAPDEYARLWRLLPVPTPPTASAYLIPGAA